MQENFPLPYLLSYSPLDVENIVIFAVAMLTAILVSAEGQAFIATLMGDDRVDAKGRLHFNVFLHMSIPGTLNFFVAGFGWPRKVDIDVTRFKSAPQLRLVISRLAGPMANIILANIAASLNWILGRWDVEDQVFSAIVLVNVTMAIYSLIIIPPLPGSSVLYALFPDNERTERIKKGLEMAGPYIILLAFLAIRLSGWDGIARIFNPIVLYISSFILVG